MSKFYGPRGKFNNRKIETALDGKFDSEGEWKRWLFLKDAERQGKIQSLQRQVKFVLIPTQYRTEIVHLKTKDKEVQRVAEREITYTADFVYYKDGTKVVEDYKGFPNDRWPLKKAMMLYFHGIAIREVKKPTEEI